MRFGFSTAGESHGPAEVALVLKVAPLDTCYLTVRDQADPHAADRRRAWLGE